MTAFVMSLSVSMVHFRAKERLTFTMGQSCLFLGLSVHLSSSPLPPPLSGSVALEKSLMDLT